MGEIFITYKFVAVCGDENNPSSIGHFVYQSEAIDFVKNNGGGYIYELHHWKY